MAETKLGSILDTPLDAAAEAAADAAAEAEIDAGKGIPHARVRAWLESWGKPDSFPVRFRPYSALGCLVSPSGCSVAGDPTLYQRPLLLTSRTHTIQPPRHDRA